VPNTQREPAQKRQEIIASVADHLLREGFRNSGLRALAKSVGISDRMIMYYFETKEELITEAMLLLADGLASGLELALPERQASGTQIVTALVDMALREDSKPMLTLWFEIVGLAVRGDEPYKSTARLFLSRWEEWIEGKLGPKHRHRAPSLLAQVEGEVMIRLLKA